MGNCEELTYEQFAKDSENYSFYILPVSVVMFRYCLGQIERLKFIAGTSSCFLVTLQQLNRASSKYHLFVLAELAMPDSFVIIVNSFVHFRLF